MYDPTTNTKYELAMAAHLPSMPQSGSDRLPTVAQGLNRCQFDITQVQQLTAYVHPRYIWERTPQAWPRGEGASDVFKPNGTAYYAGENIASTSRVYVKKKEGGPTMDVAVQNSLSLAIPDRVCALFK